jgi:phosphate transport system substrate-binding protein
MRPTPLKLRLLGVMSFVLCLALQTTGTAADITGAGGTAIYPVLSKWAEAYKAKTGLDINYQAIGSGGGIAQIKARTVDFGNSDMPLTSDELAKDGLVQFPAVIIGIVPVVNIADVDGGKLVLSGTVLADIYLGTITNWNDPAIAALNPGLALPDLKISVAHRSDGSGTTFNFADYLSKVSPAWKQKVGEGTSVSWPVGIGGKGNAGVAAMVQQINGSIGYVEYAYAAENKIACTRLKNHDGEVLVPDRAGFQAAAANADWASVRDFVLILTDQPGKQSWPITAATWIILRKDAPPETNKALLTFADWFLTDAQATTIATGLNYVPFPEATVKLIQAYWKTNLSSSY